METKDFEKLAGDFKSMFENGELMKNMQKLTDTQNQIANLLATNKPIKQKITGFKGEEIKVSLLPNNRILIFAENEETANEVFGLVKFEKPRFYFKRLWKKFT